MLAPQSSNHNTPLASRTKCASYRICWSTEAAQKILEHVQASIKTGKSNPYTYESIIRMLHFAKYDGPVLGKPDLLQYLYKDGGTVYEIFVKPAASPADGSLAKCEVIDFGICQIPRLCRLA